MALVDEVRKLGYDKRRSPLWLYMREHWPEVEQSLDEGATWAVIAEVLARLGAKTHDAAGKPPSPARARVTYLKVKAALDGSRKEEARSEPVRAVPRQDGAKRRSWVPE